ncbi:AAA family ATPase [Streptomyces alboniger]|uniref:ATP-binding protein n=1 Tax=Streptomyces alboniger TaxID=132473 RepID=A0A5J6HF60_STRAD|nr:AAA family ATPase [Streptomyces alboniger]QEV17031.1 hypothetical protein CP975_05555 [Streptomyces alboniger]
MQHAVGSPLPPPPQPGHGPATGWSPAAHHPSAPPPGAVPPGGPQPPAPGFVGGPAPHAPGQMPHAPGQPPPRAQGQPPHQQGQPPHQQSQSPHPRGQGQGPATLQLGHGPVSPNPDTTGHIQLPPGGPVAMPSPPLGTAQADTGATTLAVLLIGPAGAGKTSVAKFWAEHRRVPTAHISLDDVREWVRSGFADPQSGWNDHSEAQYRLARRTCGFAARNFLANGISCILDDAVFPDRPVVGLGGWKRHVGPGLLPVVLLPGLEVVLERNALRSGNRRLTDEEVARIHGRMAGWYGSGLPIIDNSQLDVPATARVLDDALARAIASPPQW